MDIKETVARRVRMARAERSWKQSDLAERIGSTQRYVSKLESGQVSVGIETLDRIARALHKPVTYFFEAIEEEPAPFAESRATAKKKAA